MSRIVKRLDDLGRFLRIADHPDNRLILHPQPANYYAALVAEAAAEIKALTAALEHWQSYYGTCPCGAWISQLDKRPHVSGCPGDSAAVSLPVEEQQP